MKDLYKRSLIQIPAPHFVVFYNGAEKCREQEELKLSDAFQTREENPELELRVQVLNINEGYNGKLKEQCGTLAEYMQYVEKVRKHLKAMELEEAVDKAVDECIRQDILKEFLLKNKAEVKRMSIYEYDEELARQVIREEASCGGPRRQH